MVRLPHNVVSPPRAVSVISPSVCVAVGIFYGTYTCNTPKNPCTTAGLMFSMEWLAVFIYCDMMGDIF